MSGIGQTMEGRVTKQINPKNGCSPCGFQNKEDTTEGEKGWIKFSDEGDSRLPGMPPKLNVFLDLDSTLICSLSMDGKDPEISHMPTQYQKLLKYHDMKNYYRIFERPGLQQFLTYLFDHYNVSVFTAADKDYAIFIVDRILIGGRKERKLEYLFYGYHSGISENIFKSPKDLRLLWDVFQLPGHNKCNTIIVDDLPAVYKANPNNTVRAPPFEILSNRKKFNHGMIHDRWLIQATLMIDSKRTEMMKRCKVGLGGPMFDVSRYF